MKEKKGSGQCYTLTIALLETHRRYIGEITGKQDPTLIAGPEPYSSFEDEPGIVRAVMKATKKGRRERMPLINPRARTEARSIAIDLLRQNSLVWSSSRLYQPKSVTSLLSSRQVPDRSAANDSQSLSLFRFEDVRTVFRKRVGVRWQTERVVERHGWAGRCDRDAGSWYGKYKVRASSLNSTRYDPPELYLYSFLKDDDGHQNSDHQGTAIAGKES
jgi:hypothetical protein